LPLRGTPSGSQPHPRLSIIQIKVLPMSLVKVLPMLVYTGLLPPGIAKRNRLRQSPHVFLRVLRVSA